jgi:hypothetical protein
LRRATSGDIFKGRVHWIPGAHAMTTPNPPLRGGSPGNPYEPPRAEVDLSLQESPGWFDRPVTARPPSAPAARFSLDCRCGRTVTVAAAQAGSTVRCDCGAEVTVPSLGRLRELSGKDRYESGTGDTIHRLIQEGELPAGRACAFSGEPTDDVLPLEVLVPRVFKRPEGEEEQVLATFGLLGYFFYGLFRHPEIVEEHAIKVPTPLRVAGWHHPKVRRISQRRLKRLLRTMPVYAKLLDENPYARVSVAGRAP